MRELFESYQRKSLTRTAAKIRPDTCEKIQKKRNKKKEKSNK
jgi:hypothetical protein